MQNLSLENVSPTNTMVWQLNLRVVKGETNGEGTLAIYWWSAILNTLFEDKIASFTWPGQAKGYNENGKYNEMKNSLKTSLLHFTNDEEVLSYT